MPSIRLRVDRIAYRGAGVARAPDGAVCFVPGTCPGELVEAEIAEERKSFRRMRLARVLEPSPERLPAPECLLPGGRGPVPGCVYGHARHEAEVSWKNEQLREFLVRQAGLVEAGSIPEAPFVSPRALHYRNKCTMHTAFAAGGGRLLGYFGEDNATIVDVPTCPLSVPEIDEALAETRRDGAFWRHAGAGATLGLRWTRADGVVAWVDRPRAVRSPPSPLPDLTEETPVLGRMRVPARGFWQMNGAVGGALVEAATAILRNAAPERLLDLYCGSGVFGLSAARAGVPRVFGADSGRDVIRAAAENASDLGLSARARFACADVSRAAGRLLSEDAGPGGAVIVDPPRAGLDPRVVAALLAHPVGLLLYVSCAPDTLARDLRRLCIPGGYGIRSARLFDMFPRTAHFETLCVLGHGSAHV